MQKGLVSVLTPCYNTAHLVSRLLDSVVLQTYPSIEMFIIDDGSTDNLREICESYRIRFEKKGYCLIYIHQENQGQSVAINNGLKLINGEYLVWPDSDDYYASNDAIEKMVFRLNDAQDDCAIVRSMTRVLDEHNLSEIKILGQSSKEIEDKSMFVDCLFNRNGFYFGAGSYMVKVDALKKVSGMSIYTHQKAGQNWQIFLPILYSYRCITIKEPLYNVLQREASHSRDGNKGYEKQLLLLKVYEKTIIETLNRIVAMPRNECAQYSELVSIKYSNERLMLAYNCRKRKDFIKEYSKLTTITDNISLKYKIYRYSVMFKIEPLADFIILIFRKVKCCLVR